MEINESGLFLRGDERGLDCIKNAANGLRKLAERWDNRLSFEWLSFPEKYLEGRLRIALEFEWAGVCGKPHYVEYSAFSNAKSAVVHRSAAYCQVYVRKPRGPDGGDEQTVLVGDVEVVQPAYIGVPSLAVGPYCIDDDVDDGRLEGLHFSALNGAYKFLGGFGKRKFCVFSGDLFVGNQQVADHQVERGSQAVDGITDDCGGLARGWCGDPHGEDVISRFRPILDIDGAKVAVDVGRELGVKLTDVLVGPFDL